MHRIRHHVRDGFSARLLLKWKFHKKFFVTIQAYFAGVHGLRRIYYRRKEVAGESCAFIMKYNAPDFPLNSTVLPTHLWYSGRVYERTFLQPDYLSI